MKRWICGALTLLMAVTLLAAGMPMTAKAEEPGGTVSVSVTVVWDNTYDDETNPARGNLVTADLCANGGEIKGTANLTPENDWTDTVELPRCDADGNEITYTLTNLVTPELYGCKVTGNAADGFEIGLKDEGHYVYYGPYAADYIGWFRIGDGPLKEELAKYDPDLKSQTASEWQYLYTTGEGKRDAKLHFVVVPSPNATYADFADYMPEVHYSDLATIGEPASTKLGLSYVSHFERIYTLVRFDFEGGSLEQSSVPEGATLNGDGGSVDFVSKSGPICITSAQMKQIQPTREGYTFLGWAAWGRWDEEPMSGDPSTVDYLPDEAIYVSLHFLAHDELNNGEHCGWYHGAFHEYAGEPEFLFKYLHAVWQRNEEPTDPDEPFDPLDPSDPSDPSNPSEPSNPTETEASGETTAPTVPAVTTAPTEPAVTPKTGDEAPLGLWVLRMTLSVVVIAALTTAAVWKRNQAKY